MRKIWINAKALWEYGQFLWAAGGGVIAGSTVLVTALHEQQRLSAAAIATLCIVAVTAGFAAVAAVAWMVDRANADRKPTTDEVRTRIRNWLDAAGFKVQIHTSASHPRVPPLTFAFRVEEDKRTTVVGYLEASNTLYITSSLLVQKAERDLFESMPYFWTSLQVEMLQLGVEFEVAVLPDGSVGTAILNRMLLPPSITDFALNRELSLVRRARLVIDALGGGAADAKRMIASAESTAPQSETDSTSHMRAVGREATPTHPARPADHQKS